MNAPLNGERERKKTMKSTGTQKLSDWSTHSHAVCFALVQGSSEFTYSLVTWFSKNLHSTTTDTNYYYLGSGR